MDIVNRVYKNIARQFSSYFKAGKRRYKTVLWQFEAIEIFDWLLIENNEDANI